MPKGPQGQKRKADVIGNAVLIGKIATGEESEAPHVAPTPKKKGASKQTRAIKSGKDR